MAWSLSARRAIVCLLLRSLPLVCLPIPDPSLEMRPRRVLVQRAELLENLAFPLRQPLRYLDVHFDQEVSSSTRGARPALALDPQRLPVTRAAGNLDGDRNVRRRHLDLCAERGLGKGHW